MGVRVKGWRRRERRENLSPPSVPWSAVPWTSLWRVLPTRCRSWGCRWRRNEMSDAAAAAAAAEVAPHLAESAERVNPPGPPPKGAWQCCWRSCLEQGARAELLIRREASPWVESWAPEGWRGGRGRGRCCDCWEVNSEPTRATQPRETAALPRESSCAPERTDSRNSWEQMSLTSNIHNSNNHHLRAWLTAGVWNQLLLLLLLLLRLAR